MMVSNSAVDSRAGVLAAESVRALPKFGGSKRRTKREIDNLSL